MWRILGVLVALAGCGEGAPGPVSLAEPIDIAASGTALKSYVQFRANDSHVSIPLGKLALRAHVDDSRAVIDHLEMPLGDMDPAGIPLRDMRLGMAPPVRAEIVRRSADELGLSVRVPLVMRWELAMPDGTQYTLGPIYTEVVTVAIDVWRSDGSERISVSTRCPAECWSMPGVVTVQDVVVYALAEAEVTAR